MQCIITTGPTYEPMDKMRRLTNASTGRTGLEIAVILAHYISDQDIYIWRGNGSTFPVENAPLSMEMRCHVESFTTPANLLKKFQKYSSSEITLIFHLAAVNDFGFKGLYEQQEDGSLKKIPSSTKYPSRFVKPLFAKLSRTPKILPQLRTLFPSGFIVGWKFETEGSKDDLLRKAQAQLEECKSDLCVMNGPGYQKEFGCQYGVLASASDCNFSPIANIDELVMDLVKRAHKRFPYAYFNQLPS